MFGIPGLVLAFPRQAKKVPWVGSIFVLAGIGIIFGGYAAWSSDRSFDENSAETNAILTEDAVANCSSSAQGGETCSWTAEMAYKVEGAEHSGTGGAPVEAVAGDTITIKYLPEDPTTFRSDAGLSAVGIDVGTGGDWAYWVLPVVGLLVFALGVFLFGHKIREQRGQPPTR